MTKSRKNPLVDRYINDLGIWKDESEKLREILLDSGLTEEIKWNKPCYTYNNKNVVAIQTFKAYFALLFFKGYLLKDPARILNKTGSNTRIGRQIRFRNVDEIIENEAVIKEYVQQAREV